MMHTKLQNHCLHHMGFTLWQKRVINYLLFLKKPDNFTQTQLVKNLVTALKWPPEQILPIYLTENTQSNFIAQELEKYKPQKAIVFGAFENPAINVIRLPLVAELANNVALKRKAWQDLQVFIELRR